MASHVRLADKFVISQTPSLDVARGAAAAQSPGGCSTLVGLDSQQEALVTFLQGVAKAQENNSILIVGGKGTGKTALLRSALQRVAAEVPSVASSALPFLVVVLDGSLIADDAAALRSLSSQLALDVDADTALPTFDLQGGREASSGSGVGGGAAGQEGKKDFSRAAAAAAAAEEAEAAPVSVLDLFRLGQVVKSKILEEIGGARAPVTPPRQASAMEEDETALDALLAENLDVCGAAGRGRKRTKVAASTGPTNPHAEAVIAALRGVTGAGEVRLAAAQRMALSLLSGGSSGVGGDKVRAPPAVPALPAATLSAAFQALSLVRSTTLSRSASSLVCALQSALAEAMFAVTPAGAGQDAPSIAARLAAAHAAVMSAMGSAPAAAGAAGSAGEGRDALGAGGRSGGVVEGRGQRSAALSAPVAGGKAPKGTGQGRGAGASAAAAEVTDAGGEGAGANGISYEAHLDFVLRALRDGRLGNGTSGSGRPRPVFVVIDRFDAFARRSRQTLLYSLLDLTQSPSVHLAVVGMTSNADTTDMLEKRLKSRFSSHHIVLGAPVRPAHAHSLLRAALEAHGSGGASASQWEAGARAVLADGGVQARAAEALRAGAPAAWYSQWVARALRHAGTPVKGRACASVPSPSAFLSRSVLACIGEDGFNRVTKTGAGASAAPAPYHTLSPVLLGLLPSCTTLDLALLVTAAGRLVREMQGGTSASSTCRGTFNLVTVHADLMAVAKGAAGSGLGAAAGAAGLAMHPTAVAAALAAGTGLAAAEGAGAGAPKMAGQLAFDANSAFLAWGRLLHSGALRFSGPRDEPVPLSSSTPPKRKRGQAEAQVAISYGAADGAARWSGAETASRGGLLSSAEVGLAFEPSELAAALEAASRAATRAEAALCPAMTAARPALQAWLVTSARGEA
jgi:Cdc6-like AAA superfamily ATPase